MLRWFLAKLSIIKKVFNFGDDSDNSDDNDNKNGVHLCFSAAEWL